MCRYTESQFLLDGISIINFNTMSGRICRIAKRPSAPGLLNKIAVDKLLILCFGHISNVTVCLTSFLHLHGELKRRYHTKRKGCNRGKQEGSQKNG